jgi:ferredoxin-NADP reductase
MVLELGGAEGKYYICGSERFILGIQARLLEAGVTSERIVIENFR